MLSRSPPARRVSIFRSRPTVHPNCWRVLLEHCPPCLVLRIVRSEGADHANEAHALGLLRLGHNRPGRRATKKDDELAPSHLPPPRLRSGTPCRFNLAHWNRPMSALGQKRTFALHQPMSALPPIATAKVDIRNRSCPLYP